MLFPIGIQSFEEIRNSGYVYVDKTAQIHQLTINGKYYFLSRPRRFGKSLLLSTMEAYFLGQKELFKGLAMEQLEKEWTPCPVLHLDLNQGNYQNPDELDKVLNDALCGWEQIYGSSPSEETLGLRFAGIVKRAFAQTGQQVVILIDEYDKPLLQVIDNDAVAGCLPLHTQVVLLGAEIAGPIHPFCVPHGCHQVQQGEHLQRPQQP
jgi:hypothetical protein